MIAQQTRFGIRPEFVYRRSDPETKRILGLGDTAIDDAIAAGYIDPPAPLTASGRAKGWLGSQLIALIERRLAAATRHRAEPQQLRTARKKKKRG